MVTAQVALSHTFPDLFDVKCLECDVRDERAQPCPAYKYDAATKRALRNVTAMHAPHLTKSLYATYQYQLNLPGSVSGSYSRNLNHIWGVGSVVAMWDALATGVATPRRVAATPRLRRG